MEMVNAMSDAAATVSGLNPGTESKVIGQQQWEEICARRSAGQSISSIARELGLDRKTVRSCVQQAAWVPYRRGVESDVARLSPRVAHRARAGTLVPRAAGAAAP